MLLETNFDATNVGGTPLWLATAGGHTKLLELLLDHGADTEMRTYPKNCKMHKPEDCLFADGKVLECTALQLSIAHGHREVARLLVEKGGSLETTLIHVEHKEPSILVLPTQKAFKEYRILELAAKPQAIRLERLQLLIDLGVKVNEVGEKNRTALHIVTEAGVVVVKSGEISRVTEMLLQNGADVNAREEYNLTPLHHAVSAGRLEIVKILP